MPRSKELYATKKRKSGLISVVKCRKNKNGKLVYSSSGKAVGKGVKCYTSKSAAKRNSLVSKFGGRSRKHDIHEKFTWTACPDLEKPGTFKPCKCYTQKYLGDTLHFVNLGTKQDPNIMQLRHEDGNEGAIKRRKKKADAIKDARKLERLNYAGFYLTPIYQVSKGPKFSEGGGGDMMFAGGFPGYFDGGFDGSGGDPYINYGGEYGAAGFMGHSPLGLNSGGMFNQYQSRIPNLFKDNAYTRTLLDKDGQITGADMPRTSAGARPFGSTRADRYYHVRDAYNEALDPKKDGKRLYEGTGLKEDDIKEFRDTLPQYQKRKYYSMDPTTGKAEVKETIRRNYDGIPVYGPGRLSGDKTANDNADILYDQILSTYRIGTGYTGGLMSRLPEPEQAGFGRTNYGFSKYF
jgi:hypothetical protein